MPGQLAAKVRAKFPGAYDDLSDAQLEAAVLRKYPEYADLVQEPTPAAHVRRGPDISMSSLTARRFNPAAETPRDLQAPNMTEYLPAVGGAVGGIVGGIGGTVAGMGVGGIPGAVGGATLGGMAGEATRQLARRGMGQSAPATPLASATAIGTQGALQGGSELAGGMLVKGALKAGPMLMQSAVKPASRQLKAMATGKVEIPKVVQTLLDEGISVTAGGMQKVKDLLSATDDQISSIIASSKQTIAPENVAKRVEDTAERFAQQVNPTADVAAVDDVAREFLNVHRGGTSMAGPARPLSVQHAQQLKTGTYRQLDAKAYTGELKSASVEAQKALARGLKEEIETAVKKEGTDIGPINARHGALTEAKAAIGHRLALAGNRDPVGLGFVAENPAAALGFVMSRSPAVKSMLGRGLYQSAERASGVPQNVIRLAVLALAQSGDEP